VQRINLSWFTAFGEQLAPLLRFHELDHNQGKLALLTVKPSIDYLMYLSNTGAFPLSIRSSKPGLSELSQIVDGLLNLGDADYSIAFESRKYEVWIKTSEVKTILNAELGVQPTYLVFPKRAYDTEVFISDGTKLFSDDCRAEFTDDEKYDITEAAKCLAFEVPTAAAFHIVRAVESVIRRYYHVAIGTLPKSKSRNWSVYIKRLKENGVDLRITSVLEEIRELYRNPIIHPEIKMSMDESLSLLGIAETAIGAMLSDARKRRSTTVSASAPIPLHAASAP
jgi:hypothetical protein